MSVVERTVASFPRGRTTGELLALLDVDFDPIRRRGILSELDTLQETGKVRRGRDGRWRAHANAIQPRVETSGPLAGYEDRGGAVLTAVPAQSTSTTPAEPPLDQAGNDITDIPSLLRYYRSALRADPRGSISQHADRHGVSWQLVSGFEWRSPVEAERITLQIRLDDLPGDFRQALAKRAANETTLCIGWPIAVVQRMGVAITQPVGLVAAEWSRSENTLSVALSADDVLVNPDWIKSSARPLGWNEAALRELLEGANGDGLSMAEFRARLREAAASQVRDGIEFSPKPKLPIGEVGIHAAAALFLPTDTTFTAGAVRDLDQIANWSAETRQATALGALFDHVEPKAEVPALSVGPLNAEQLDAVRHACTKPVTVVTGPPGTGKSQAITAMVASTLAAGGTVLVASKNHQALDAVEDRLSALASSVPFLVRTLDPARDIDESFHSVLKAIVGGATREPHEDDADADWSALLELVIRRNAALDGQRKHDALRGDLAEVVERIALRQGTAQPQTSASEQYRSRLARLLAFIFRRRGSRDTDKSLHAHGVSLRELERGRERLQKELSEVDLSQDPVALTKSVTQHTVALLPRLLAARCLPAPEMRQSLSLSQAESELAGATRNLEEDVIDQVADLRPLWLASVLGTPKRVPLKPGLFDLVIFDEASQCDIASALPLFARARRAVVVGDDRQLSAIPQLGIAQDRNLMSAQGLGTTGMGRFAQSRRSLFDFANDLPGVARILLRDQYRSAPDIVSYISDHFYGGQLRPAGSPDRFVTPEATKPGLAWTDVPSPALPQRANVNPAEVDAILRHLSVLLVEQGYRGSVGVIAPFRPQVAALADAIRSAISDDVLDAVAFRAGTVDAFQGQERDLILFSPCVGPSAAPSAVQFLQKDWRRLNVAISRAKAVAHVFGDLGYARSGKITSLQRLAARATEPKRMTRDGDFDSEWERRVFHALKARGLDPVPQYEIAGRRLDFALFGAGGVKLDLEVDGRLWHMDTDGRRKQSDLWRDHMLRGLGWRVRRFWVDELSDDMEKCLDLVERDLA